MTIHNIPSPKRPLGEFIQNKSKNTIRHFVTEEKN